eukprot:1160185-Pelagomonas_calceolata.AAC.10
MQLLLKTTLAHAPPHLNQHQQLNENGRVMEWGKASVWRDWAVRLRELRVRHEVEWKGALQLVDGPEEGAVDGSWGSTVCRWS